MRLQKLLVLLHSGLRGKNEDFDAVTARVADCGGGHLQLFVHALTQHQHLSAVRDQLLDVSWLYSRTMTRS